MKTKSPCKGWLFTHHDFDETTKREEETFEYDWLILHNVGTQKPWNIVYKTCKRCGEEVCLGGYEAENRFGYRIIDSRSEYERLKVKD